MPRQIEFAQDIADAICERLVEGESLRTICLDDEMPACSTVFKWLSRNEEFAEQYAHAREAQADYIFDEILDIADDATNDWMVRNGEDENEGWEANGEHIQRSKIRIDARKWMAGKLRPKKYSDKVVHAGDPENPLEVLSEIRWVLPDK